MAQPKVAVHRPLSLHTPILKGGDVRALQGKINDSFEHLRIDRRIEVDGQLGAQTFAAAKQVARCLGVRGAAAKKLQRGTISEGTQKLIRGRKRTRLEAIAGRARKGYRETLRRRHSKTAGELAIERSDDLVGVHETPDGSNWGGMVETMIRFTGYTFPVYWCGCFACWVVVKLGGAKIPNRIRLGFAEYIVRDAQAGANGLSAVPVSKARTGDLGSLSNYQHIVVVREDVKPGDTMVKTREGNTSASTASGSQFNGGQVADKERPLSDFDDGIVARPAWA